MVGEELEWDDGEDGADEIGDFRDGDDVVGDLGELIAPAPEAMAITGHFREARTGVRPFESAMRET